jgi:hypothetical protein
MTYYGWEHSAFSTGDPKTTVSCQDCHMVRRMTGEPVREQARMVPWGPVRQGARSHLFLGGNVQAALSLGDPGLAQKEHDLNASAATIGISQVQRNDDALDVTVAVRSERVGHYFPALETKLRYGWIEVKALDASGAVVARTSPPKDSEDFGAASALIMSSVDDPKRDTQRLVAPRTSREFTSHLALPTGARVQAVVAELYNRVDPAPIATTSRSLPAPDPPL